MAAREDEGVNGDDQASRSKDDPVTDNVDDLPDLFGEDPDDKKPLVADGSVDPDEGSANK